MRSPLRQTMVLAFAAIGAAVVPSPASAQVELAPTLGMYLPVGGWTEQQLSDSVTGFAMRRRQIPAVMVGARLLVWTTKRLSFEGTFSYSPSQVAVETYGQTTDVPAGVVLASARVQYMVASLADGKAYDRWSWDVVLGAGVGVVRRAGTAWENTSGTTAPTVLLSAALGTYLTRSVMLRFGLEDFLSWAQFDRGAPSQTRARLHHDMIGSLGVAVRVAGRGHR